jgi:hypothetical protein
MNRSCFQVNDGAHLIKDKRSFDLPFPSQTRELALLVAWRLRIVRQAVTQ